MNHDLQRSPRAHLQRILQFHPSLKNHALAVLFCFLGTAFLSLLYSSHTLLFQDSQKVILLSLICCGSSLILAYGAYLFWKSLAKSKVRIETDHLVYDAERKQRLIFYQDVINFDLQNLSFKTKSGEEFHFLPYIERPEYVLESFYRAKPSLMPEAEFTRLRNEMIVWDHQQHRSGIFRNSLKALFYGILTVTLFALLLWWFGGLTWSNPVTFGISGALFFVSLISYYFVFQKQQARIQDSKREELQRSFFKTARDYSIEAKYSHWGLVTLLKVQGVFVSAALLWMFMP